MPLISPPGARPASTCKLSWREGLLLNHESFPLEWSPQHQVYAMETCLIMTRPCLIKYTVLWLSGAAVSCWASLYPINPENSITPKPCLLLHAMHPLTSALSKSLCVVNPTSAVARTAFTVIRPPQKSEQSYFLCFGELSYASNKLVCTTPLVVIQG